MKYTQCQLRKHNVRRMAFIPSRFAVQGDVLRIAEGSGQARRWVDGWIVEAVFQERERDEVIAIERAYERSGVHSPVPNVVSR